MKITEKKLANNELYCQNRRSNIPFGPLFKRFCPVLALTKVGSADYNSWPNDQIHGHFIEKFMNNL
jgi:hypothetical protein